MTGDLKKGRHPRLLWIHQNFVSARQPGNSRAIHLVSALLEQGWHVDVVTSQSGYLDDEAPSRQRQKVLVEREGRLTIYRLKHAAGVHRRGRSYLAFMAGAMRFVLGRNSADLVLASTPPLPHVLLSAVASLWKNAPLMLEVRDLWPSFLVQAKLLKSLPWIMVFEWVEAFAYRYADHCISVSPAFLPYLKSMGLRAEGISVAPTGADPYYRQADRAGAVAWRNQQNLGGKLMILYAGSFNDFYALPTVLRAVRELGRRRDDIVWVFAGNGRFRSHVETAAGELDCVRYLGALPKDQLTPVLLAADIGLVSLADWPVLDAIMPGKLFDYLAAGVPVLSNNRGLAGAIVETARAGFVLREPTVEHYVKTLIEIAEMPRQSLRDAGSRGQDWVLEHINSADMARYCARVISALAEQHRRQSRFLRLLRAGVLACKDVFSRRSARVLRRLEREDLRQAARDSLDQWMAQADAAHTTTGLQEIPIPALLSNRHARD